MEENVKVHPWTFFLLKPCKSIFKSEKKNKQVFQFLFWNCIQIFKNLMEGFLHLAISTANW